MVDEDSKKTKQGYSAGNIPDEIRRAQEDATRTSRTGGTRDRDDDTSEGTAGDVNQPADRFTLTEVLGEGTQGEVCKAFDNRLQRHVAIKFPHRINDEETAKDILAEARKAARLNHSNVVTIFEVGFWKNRPFIAMELVEGVSLATIITECGRISVDRYLGYARQILAALEAAHASGLVHRDLKPHNVLLATDGTLKLTDFGVAHAHSEISGHESTVNVSIAGTPAYMAPEQWLGKKPDARSDIYAFGCVSFKLLAGQNVFPTKDLMQHHLEDKPPALRSVAPHVPENLERIIMRCLAKKRENRYQSSAEVSAAIDLAAKSSAGAGTAAWPANDQRKSKKTIVVVASALALLIVVWFAFLEPGRRQWQSLMESFQSNSPVNPPDPVDEPEEKQTDSELLEFKKREQEGLEYLDKARRTEEPEERIQLATLAKERLGHLATEYQEASLIIKDAVTAKERITEKMTLDRFQKLLQETKRLRDLGQAVDALEKLFEAERLMGNTASLRVKSSELGRLKLPLLATLAADALNSGDFEEAARSFEDAGKIADMLTLKTRRDGYRQDAELCSKLDKFDRIVQVQPRYVLAQLTRWRDNFDEMPSARLICARAWLALGAEQAARKEIDVLLASADSQTLKNRAKELLQELN